MSNASVAGADGRARRKTLSDQLDRLDQVIDDLAAGLNETVTQAVQQAVEGLAQAVLSNPEVLRNLAEQLSPPSREEATASPSAGESPTSGPPVGPLARSRCGVSSPLRRAGAACAAVRRRVGALVDGVRDRLRLARLPLIVLAVRTEKEGPHTPAASGNQPQFRRSGGGPSGYVASHTTRHAIFAPPFRARLR